MRKHLSSALLRSVALIALALPLLVSCGKDDAPASSTDTVPSRNIPSGDISTPEWNVSPDYDYSSSMTAVVDVDLMQTFPDLTPPPNGKSTPPTSWELLPARNVSVWLRSSPPTASSSSSSPHLRPARRISPCATIPPACTIFSKPTLFFILRTAPVWAP